MKPSRQNVGMIGSLLINFTGTLVKPKFGMLQNYFCRNSKFLVDVDNIFSHAL